LKNVTQCQTVKCEEEKQWEQNQSSGSFLSSCNPHDTSQLESDGGLANSEGDETEIGRMPQEFALREVAQISSQATERVAATMWR
jgi:hypothetical protein